MLYRELKTAGSLKNVTSEKIKNTKYFRLNPNKWHIPHRANKAAAVNSVYHIGSAPLHTQTRIYKPIKTSKSQ